MDRSAEDMKSMGLFGIFKHSLKTIFSSKKLFTQITLTLILPLSLIFFGETEIENHLFLKSESTLSNNVNSTYLHNITVSDWVYYCLFNILYFALIAVFYLLSTAAVIFTIASVYSNYNVVCMQVIKNVSKIWKKLLVTFVLIIIYFIYIGIRYLILIIIPVHLHGYSSSGSFFIVMFFIFYVLGFLYLTVVLQLTIAVSVLENVYGIKAMKKGMYLLYGKTKVGMVIAFVFYVFLLVLCIVYELFVEEVMEFFDLAMIWRVMIGILVCVLVMMLFLLFIVIQTMLYLVCKSYHQEAVDKVSLSMFLGSFIEETVVYPNSGEGLQIGGAQTQEV